MISPKLNKNVQKRTGFFNEMRRAKHRIEKESLIDNFNATDLFTVAAAFQHRAALPVMEVKTLLCELVVTLIAEDTRAAGRTEETNVT